MPNLSDLKNRIASVKSTRKITKAMQMVASAKLRRAQDAAQAGRPKLLTGTGFDQTHLLVVMTGERGLCGGFNSNIVKLARIAAKKLLAEGKTVKVLTVGKKGRDSLKREFVDMLVDHVDLKDVKRVGYDNATAIAQNVLSRFGAGEFDVAKIFFSEFGSIVNQVPTELQVIPAKFQSTIEEGTVYDYEPSEEGILADLLPRAVATQIFTALLENAASEQGARMSAMDNATRNAGEMIDKLTIKYNRSRQAKITNELIEIISGAEAL
jgi:F-type H+-transporting ATPase subunit gamma